MLDATKHAEEQRAGTALADAEGSGAVRKMALIKGNPHKIAKNDEIERINPSDWAFLVKKRSKKRERLLINRTFVEVHQTIMRNIPLQNPHFKRRAENRLFLPNERLARSKWRRSGRQQAARQPGGGMTPQAERSSACSGTKKTSSAALLAQQGSLSGGIGNDLPSRAAAVQAGTLPDRALLAALCRTAPYWRRSADTRLTGGARYAPYWRRAIRALLAARDTRLTGGALPDRALLAARDTRLTGGARYAPYWRRSAGPRLTGGARYAPC
ncbi:hypothetical protein NYE40_22905 [Paenibacillus sp. FSL W8-1187]|uniref:hypothetical protein n=1 Tax=Paenibacillus sp. FSL W8-1187 TaxID=2975339 RepID=UPI0030D865FE